MKVGQLRQTEDFLLLLLLWGGGGLFKYHLRLLSVQKSGGRLSRKIDFMPFEQEIERVEGVNILP